MIPDNCKADQGCFLDNQYSLSDDLDYSMGGEEDEDSDWLEQESTEDEECGSEY